MNNGKNINRKRKCVHARLTLIGQILSPENILKDLYICEICKCTFIKEDGELFPIIPRYF